MHGQQQVPSFSSMTDWNGTIMKVPSFSVLNTLPGSSFMGKIPLVRRKWCILHLSFFKQSKAEELWVVSLSRDRYHGWIKEENSTSHKTQAQVLSMSCVHAVQVTIVTSALLPCSQVWIKDKKKCSKYKEQPLNMHERCLVILERSM